MVQGCLITPHEWWAMQVFALSGFGEIRPRIVGFMTIEPQADVMGESAESIATSVLIKEFTTHDNGIDHLKQVGGSAFPCVACMGREGKNSDDFTPHGF